MNARNLYASTLVAAMLSGCALCAIAQPAGGDGPPRRPPPPEALKACESLKAGAACSFTGPPGKMSGTCRAPEGKPLACAPARPPEGEMQRAPAQKP